MKKKLLFSTLLFLVFLTCVNLMAEENPTFPPIIDGEIDDVWFTTPLMPVNNSITTNAPADTNDFKADVRLLWDENHLYMLLVVRDDTIFNQETNIWNNDNAEIYLDLNNTRTPWTPGHKQLRMVAGDTVVHGFDDYYYGYKRIGGVYYMEIAIPVAMILEDFTPEVGTEIGFDLVVRDNDFGQITAFGWNTTSYDIWKDMTLAGSIRFLENNRVQRITHEENPTFPPIIDGEIDEVWQTTALMAVDKVVPSHEPVDTNDFKADVRLLWDAEYLYMLLFVRDDTIFNQAPNIWDNDNVEIYLDLKNAGIAWAEGHKQLRLVAGDTNVHGFKNYGYGYTRSAGTYIMEIAIPFDSIMDGFAPEVGTVIGFDILARDNDFGQVTARGWNTKSYNIWQDMTLAGAIEFLENNRVQRAIPNISPGNATYYVSTQGDNENSGLDEANAFKTIQFAADYSAPGDKILVMDGVYNESVQIKNTGTADGWITFKSLNRHGARVTNTWGNAFSIDGPIGFFIIDGFELVAPATYGSGVASGSGAHHITVRNCWIHSCGQSGIQLNDGDYRLIENNIVHDNAWLMPQSGSGISLYGLIPYDDASGFHSIVRGNISFNNDNGPDTHQTDGNGIIIDDFRNIQEWHRGGAVKDINYTGKETLVENNVVFNNGGYGIQIFLVNNVTLRNNTSYHNLTRRDATTWRGELNISCSKNITLVNNIGVANSNLRMDGGETNNNVFSHNTAIGAFGLTGDMFGAEYYFYNNITFDTDKPTTNSIQTSGVPGVLASIVNANGNLVATDPLFVAPGIDAESNDFRLTPESPAINAGHQANFAPNDILGQSRPVGALPDIGAYEYPVDLGVKVPWLDPTSGNIEFFPNPVKSVLNVKYDQLYGDLLVRIISLSGKEVMNQRVLTQSGNCEIDLENIPSGVYFLQIGNDEQAVVSKFVKL